jgi:hypothetical protein
MNYNLISKKLWQRSTCDLNAGEIITPINSFPVPNSLLPNGGGTGCQKQRAWQLQKHTYNASLTGAFYLLSRV